MTGLEVISADRIDSWAGKPGVVLIDLRTEEEFRKGHIQGSSESALRGTGGRQAPFPGENSGSVL